MGFHTFPTDRADKLEDPSRYRFCSREELLEMLDLESDFVVADLGSGTGFYSREVAPFAETLYAVDVQEEMHEYHREVGSSKTSNWSRPVSTRCRSTTTNSMARSRR